MLRDEALARGFAFPDGSQALFDTYRSMLCRYNEHVNLTAITEPRDVEIKHFLDSLSAEPYLDRKSVV